MFNIKPLKKIFYQAVRFSIVGVFGVLINYCVFILALVFFKIHYLISGVLGYMFATVPIFFLNRYWTFKSNVSIFKGLPIYVIINLITLSSHSLIQFMKQNTPDIKKKDSWNTAYKNFLHISYFAGFIFLVSLIFYLMKVEYAENS